MHASRARNIAANPPSDPAAPGSPVICVFDFGLKPVISSETDESSADEDDLPAH